MISIQDLLSLLRRYGLIIVSRLIFVDLFVKDGMLSVL